MIKEAFRKITEFSENENMFLNHDSLKTDGTLIKAHASKKKPDKNL